MGWVMPVEHRLRGDRLDEGLSNNGVVSAGKGEPGTSNGMRLGGGPAGMVPSTIHLAEVGVARESERRLYPRRSVLGGVLVRRREK